MHGFALRFRTLLPLYDMRSSVLMPFLWCTALAVCLRCSVRDTTATGEALSRQYCGSCHAYPAPDLLDSASWVDYVLPRMGAMLGHYPTDAPRSQWVSEQGPAAATLYPEVPILTAREWRVVQDYYRAQSPPALRRMPLDSIATDLSTWWQVQRPTVQVSPPSTTLVQFAATGDVWVGDAYSQQLMRFGADLALEERGQMKEGVVSLTASPSGDWITIMGSFAPTDEALGLVLHLPKGEKKRARIVADGLRRPVHTSVADFNGDGLEDLVVSEFGKWAGRLTLWESSPTGDYIARTLIDQTGAMRTALHDFNGDGRLDIMALFGQGNEAMYMLYQEANGDFRTERVLQWSPSHGSSWFELVDLNADGHLDIVYTAGDNADFGPVYKPQHGIYWYLNDGHNRFTQSLFYPLRGAYGAITRDFDLDGDLDMAAISFFPDFEQRPQEAFLYLRNVGDQRFTAHTFEGVRDGRWIVMDAADKDQDGDMDLVLGALTFEVKPDRGEVQRWMDGGLPFVILENLAR